MRILIADSHGSSQAGVGAIIRALGWRPQIVRTLDKLLGALRTTDAAQWPDVLIVEARPHDADARQLIAQFEKEHSFAEMPPCILVTDIEQSYVEYRKSMRTEDVLLVRPVSSSAIFNAINSAVWKRRDSYARMLNSTNFGETRAQWLVGVRVLAVDDSEVNLEVAQRILERQGAIVTTCSDGAAALDYVRAHHSVLDLVLMDVQMPVMDGNDATRRIRGELNLPDLPIIALTAGALVGERKRALEAGMSDFVSKPFDPQTLIRKARHLVEQARGEPIHVSVLQTRESQRETSGGVLMSSVDAGIVQQTFGDDLSLFTSVLSRILREFADFALPISGLGDCEQRNRLKLRAHKLKGSAGMIGAMRVMRLAGAVEAALSKNRPDEAVEKILRLLASALTTLREEAEPFLARQSKHVSRTPAPAAAPGGASRGAIDDLFGLLETQNLAADEKFSALAPSLRDCMDAAGFDRLRAAMDNLDFQLAAELLRGVLPALARPN
jgi:CheY-like chemotaxis protein